MTANAISRMTVSPLGWALLGSEVAAVLRDFPETKVVVDHLVAADRPLHCRRPGPCLATRLSTRLCV